MEEENKEIHTLFLRCKIYEKILCIFLIFRLKTSPLSTTLSSLGLVIIGNALTIHSPFFHFPSLF